jgi:hypothetical protein
MSRRWFSLLALTVAALAIAAPPALAAYGPLWSFPTGQAARLAPDGTGVTVVWAQADSGGTSLVAQRYAQGGSPAADPTTLASAVTGLGDWSARADGLGGLVVAWTDAAGTTNVRAFDATGTPKYEAVRVCDAAFAEKLRGAGAKASLADFVVTRQGNAYVLLKLTTANPAGTAGNSLLASVSGTGAARLPASVLAGGTVAAMAADNAGHLFVLLGSPGRGNVAVRRYAPSLGADWARPISPYLLGAPTALTQTPLAISVSAADGAVIAWREGSAVKVQRYDASGQRIWLFPPATTLSGTPLLACDRFAGCYLVAASLGGVSVRHFSAAGLPVGARTGSSIPLGFVDARADAVTVNRAGDLSIACHDAAAAGSAGVARMTYLGESLPTAPFAPPQNQIVALYGDTAGTCYALAAGAESRVWRLGPDGDALSARARTAAVAYGHVAAVSGYLSNNGAPVSGKNVELSIPDGHGGHQTVTAKTGADGYFAARVAPKINCVVSALAHDAGGADVSAVSARVSVRPLVTLTLNHVRSGTRYVEMLRGSVRPGHAGRQVLLQCKTGGTWRTLCSSRLDAASHYGIRWLVPQRTANYLLRVILPAHSDHAAGTSPAARLRVVFRR